MGTNAKITALPGTLPAWSFADRLRKARREYTTFNQQAMAATRELVPEGAILHAWINPT